MRHTVIKSHTIGETIDQLAEAFSGEADTNGLYILEQALDKARNLSSQERRQREFDAIMIKHNESKGKS